MPRLFDTSRSAPPEAAPGPVAGGGTAARALAVALTGLLVTFLVAERSSGAFGGEARNPGNRFAEGYVGLTDDDGGSALFDLPALVPGDTAENCIAVHYEGTVLPAVVRLGARTEGGLSPDLAMTVDVGDGGGFGTCAGFAPSARIYAGDLADFGRVHPPDRGLEVFRPSRRGEVKTLRLGVRLDRASGADGSEARADFVWVVTPASSTPPP